MNNKICNKEHRYEEKFKDLPDSQETTSDKRHKCAGCAYELGFEDGRNGLEKRQSLSDVPRSQAGAVRHKDAMRAYKMGYEEGIKSNGS